MSESPDHAPFQALYEEVRSLYPPADDVPFREGYRRVMHLAHGWYMRVVRTCDAFMLLRRDGFGAESWPLRRAALEHVLALRWLSEVGDDAVDVVVRTHAESARRRQRALANANWSAATLPIWEEVAADAQAATGNRAESNILGNMTLRTERYGAPDDLAAWMIESNHSHPGWETASPYWDRADQAPREVPIFHVNRLDAALAAGCLLRSQAALDQMTDVPGWEARLIDLGDRYQSLEAAIPRPPASEE